MVSEANGAGLRFSQAEGLFSSTEAVPLVLHRIDAQVGIVIVLEREQTHHAPPRNAARLARRRISGLANSSSGAGNNTIDQQKT